MVTTIDRRALIDRYAQGHQAVLDALAGITDQELDARPAADQWSPREIVHHLADGEMTSAIRLRRLLVEDAPALPGYDEMAFSRTLHYNDRPIQAALDALSAARRTTLEILERMTEADWARAGTHSEMGPYSVDDWLTIYGTHAHDHAAQINAVRELLRLERSGGTAAD
jgi:hypothetical protein